MHPDDLKLLIKQLSKPIKNPAIIIHNVNPNSYFEMVPKVKNKQLEDLLRTFEENIMWEVCHAISK